MTAAGRRPAGGAGAPTDAVPAGRRVCVVRFHDGRAKSNWGGRATSLALGRVVARAGGHLTSVVPGEYIINGFDVEGRRFRVEHAVTQAARRARLPVARRARYAPEEWAALPALAARIAGRPPSRRARAVVAALEAADEVWVNGEGDLILADRPTLFRTLLLTHVAAALGRPVHMTNSILSRPTSGPEYAPSVAAVGHALRVAQGVTYRDPESLRLHGELYPDVDASWRPDALFSWAAEARRLAEAAEPYGPHTEGLGPEVQGVLAEDRPYVALSGSSARFDRDVAARGLVELAGALRARSLVPVVVATDEGDQWMLDVAAEQGLAAVPSTVPLATGLTVLARASCFLSGRYHPSIMAFGAGTPCVFMGSNSHKTTSLQEVVGDPVRPELPLFGRGPVDALLAAVDAARARDRADLATRASSLSARLGGPSAS